ncbi:hypothetical protein D6825_00555 [Candidatus Woesearchaeota archaeon]|nr:MAG: hypothetical protein D6825_00555 [Candidatus Woesearchaeota archaeon]
MLNIHFLGVEGDPEFCGTLIQDNKFSLVLDPCPGAAAILKRLGVGRIDACIITDESFSYSASLISDNVVGESANLDYCRVDLSQGCVRIIVPDARIVFISDSSCALSAGHVADVIVLPVSAFDSLKSSRPRLAIFLPCIDSPNPLYVARDARKKFGVQAIAARPGLTVDLGAYSALSEQKGLGKFS